MSSIPTWKNLLKLPARITNKYVLAFIAFGVWMGFFDKNNVLIQWELSQTIHQLEEEMLYYDNQMDHIRRERHEMMTEQERYARERHHMHRQNEDLFIVRYVPKKKKT